jgi:hypothetical protein
MRTLAQDEVIDPMHACALTYLTSRACSLCDEAQVRVYKVVFRRRLNLLFLRNFIQTCEDAVC